MPHLDRRSADVVAVALGGAVATATAALAPLGFGRVPQLPRPVPASGGARVRPGAGPAITPLSRGLSGAATALLSWAPDASRLALRRRHVGGEHPPRRVRTGRRRRRCRGERARVVRRWRPHRLLGLRVGQAGRPPPAVDRDPDGRQAVQGDGARPPPVAARRGHLARRRHARRLVHHPAPPRPARPGHADQAGRHHGAVRPERPVGVRRHHPAARPRGRAGRRPARLPAARPRCRRRVGRQHLGDRAPRRQGPQAGRGGHPGPPASGPPTGAPSTSPGSAPAPPTCSPTLPRAARPSCCSAG